MKKTHVALIVLAVVAVGAVAVCFAYAKGLFGSAESVTAQVIPLKPGAVSANELALGTLLLEDTELAVTPEQAAKLAPLWQMLNALYGSTNAAQDEIDAVVRQLRLTMTEEQLEAIRSRNGSPPDMAAVMESLGIDMQRPEIAGTPGARQGFGGPGGQPPQGFGGGMGPGGGEFPAAGGFDGGQPPFAEFDMAEVRATRQASGEAEGGFMMGRANSVVIEKLVEILQTRAAAAGAAPMGR